MTRFEYQGREFFLRFDWSPPEAERITKAPSIKLREGRVAVACVVSVEPGGEPLGPDDAKLVGTSVRLGAYARGVAVVHPNDARRWSKEQGRRIALTRALEPCPRKFRRAAWRAYFAPMEARAVRQRLVADMTRRVFMKSGTDVEEELRRWEAAHQAGLTKSDTEPRPASGHGGDERALIARLCRKHVRRYARRMLSGTDGSAVVNVPECARLMCLWLDVEDNGYRLDGLGPEHHAEVREAVEDEAAP